MSFEDSPSLDKYAQGMPSRSPERSVGRRRVWIAIGVFTFLIAVLALVNLQSSGTTVTVLTGTDTIVGTVVDEDGDPLQAEVFVLKTNLEAQTDANGYFELKDAPSGSQVVIVAYLGAGREYPVVVQAGAATNMGQIQFASTRVPDSE